MEVVRHEINICIQRVFPEGTYLPSQGFELGIELGIRARNSSSDSSKVKLVKKNFTNFLFGVRRLVYEEQYGEAASCLQSLSKQLKRMEALYRNVRLPESVRGKGD